MNEITKQALEYVKIPGLYVDILMLSAGVLFLTICKYIFPNELGIPMTKFVSDDFFSGTEQTIIFFVISYFIGGLILVMANILIAVPLIITSPVLYQKTIMERFKNASLLTVGEGVSLDEVPEFGVSFNDVDVSIDQQPAVKNRFAQIERTLLILKYTFSFFIFFGIFAHWKYFLVGIIVYAVAVVKELDKQHYRIGIAKTIFVKK